VGTGRQLLALEVAANVIEEAGRIARDNDGLKRRLAPSSTARPRGIGTNPAFLRGLVVLCPRNSFTVEHGGQMGKSSISSAQPKCRGTVEDYGRSALDIRDRALRHARLFDLPAGHLWSNRLAWPWIKQMRTMGHGIEVFLSHDRIEHIELVSVACGFAGRQHRFLCPRCGRRVCTLYFFDARLACRICCHLWYSSQRVSSTARKFLAMRKVRRKLRDYGQHWMLNVPPKPSRMWKRTYQHHCAALARIERSLNTRKARR